jgi:TPR repeat protein
MQEQLKAIYWYRKAAAKNDAKAMFNLGLCFEFGDGVRKSLRWAKHYYQNASELGHRKATNKLKKL